MKGGGNKNTEELRGEDQVNFIVTRPETFFQLNHSYHICTQAIYTKFRRKRHFALILVHHNISLKHDNCNQLFKDTRYSFYCSLSIPDDISSAYQ